MTNFLEEWQAPGLGDWWMWTSAQSADDTARYGWLEYGLQGGRTHYHVSEQTHFGVSERAHYSFTEEDG